MEPKLVSIEILPEHPKLMRLPSLSRSLRHSILPRAHQEAHNHPVIYTIRPRVGTPAGPPNFVSKARKRKSRSPSVAEKAVNLRPSTPSYLYKKFFGKHKENVEYRPLISSYQSARNASSPKALKPISYYCEIQPPKMHVKTLRPKSRKLNKTMIEFPIEEQAQGKSLIHNHFFASGLKKEIFPSMQIRTDSENDMRNIPEVQSSLEMDHEDQNNLRPRSLSLYNRKRQPKRDASPLRNHGFLKFNLVPK